MVAHGFEGASLEENDMPALRILTTIALFLRIALPNGMAQADPAQAQALLPLQYAATAIGQAGSVAGKSFGLKVYVQELTSDAEMQELVATLKHKGQDGLVSALENIKDMGRVSPLSSVGTGMRFVRIRPTKDGGQHIVMATNRPISFPELYNATRSSQYQDRHCGARCR